MTHALHRVLATGISAAALFAGAAQADEVFIQDVIVQGSLCVGFDCVNGENFGSDTIRMKENNTRIKFQDTSNSASFPTVDWQLTANESTNGGLNKFSIESIDNSRIPFTVEYGAGSNALYVDDGGRIGLGTSAPVVELHVVNGDSPTLRLEQDGSSGFAAQTWDLAGNETNFFVRDVTNGSRLPFKIRPSAPTNSLFVDTDGDIGLGTASPDARLDVRGSANQTAMKVVSGGGSDLASFEGVGTQLMYLESTDGGAAQFRIKSSGGNRRVIGMTNGGSIQSQMVLGTNEILLAGPTDAGADLWARINASGIFTQGPSCNPGPCDRTFDASYFTPPSIEEHAEFMWENSYLWGVGPTSPGLSFNLTEKSAGMLHELEIAHIYIEQLHNRLNALEEQVLTK